MKKFIGVVMLFLVLPFTLTALYRLFEGAIGVYVLFERNSWGSPVAVGIIMGGIAFGLFMATLAYACLHYGRRLIAGKPLQQRSAVRNQEA